MGGIVYLTGHPETPPARCGASIGDSVAGILAALHQREATGRSVKVEISMVDTMIGLLRAISTQYFELNEIPTRRGCAVRGVVPHNIL